MKKIYLILIIVIAIICAIFVGREVILSFSGGGSKVIDPEKLLASGSAAISDISTVHFKITNRIYLGEGDVDDDEDGWAAVFECEGGMDMIDKLYYRCREVLPEYEDDDQAYFEAVQFGDRMFVADQDFWVEDLDIIIEDARNGYFPERIFTALYPQVDLRQNQELSTNDIKAYDFEVSEETTQRLRRTLENMLAQELPFSATIDGQVFIDTKGLAVKQVFDIKDEEQYLEQVELEYLSFNEALDIPNLDNIVKIQNPNEIGDFSGWNLTTTDGRNAKRMSDARTLKSILEQYYNDNGTYPVTSGDEKILSESSIGEALIPDYLEELPSDPNPEYYYGYQSLGEQFKLTFLIEKENKEVIIQEINNN